MRQKRWMAALALGAALATALPAGQASAKRKPGQLISVIANGRKVVFRGKKLITSSHSEAGVAFGGGNTPHRLGQLLRSVVVGCAVDLSGPLPIDGSSCVVGYGEVKFSRHPTVKTWGSADGVRVTFDSFDGTTLRGSFEGTVGPVAGDATAGEGTVNLQNGKFTIVFTD